VSTISTGYEPERRFPLDSIDEPALFVDLVSLILNSTADCVPSGILLLFHSNIVTTSLLLSMWRIDVMSNPGGTERGSD